MPISFGQFGRDLDERLGHQLHVHGIVLGPVVIVLGQPVSRADDVEALARRADICPVGVVNFLTTGLFDWFGMQRIGDGALDGLVVLRETARRRTPPAGRRSGRRLRDS